MRPLARREAEAAIVTVQQEKQDALAACRRLGALSVAPPGTAFYDQ